MFALHLLRVPVSDPEAAKSFWTALTGRQPSAEAPDEGWVRYDFDGLDLILFRPAPEDAGRSPGTALDFRLSHEDLDTVAARLPASADATVRKEADGARRLVAQDPDGNLVHIEWRMPER